MFIVLYRPLPDGRETLGSMISILSPTNQETEFYETIATGHEYEILDKYHGNQVYEISPMAEPKPETIQLQPTGDYKFTQCPAYILSLWQPPVSTANLLQLNQLLHKMIKLRVVDYSS